MGWDEAELGRLRFWTEFKPFFLTELLQVVKYSTLRVRAISRRSVRSEAYPETKRFWTLAGCAALRQNRRWGPALSPSFYRWGFAVDGAVVTEFSSTNRDEVNIFTDPRVRRVLKNLRAIFSINA